MGDTHKVVSKDQWLAARVKLLAAEKEFTHARHHLSQQRRDLPWERVDKDPDVRVAILTSSDCGTFCAGMDLKETSRVKQETGKDLTFTIQSTSGNTIRSSVIT